MIPPIAIIPCRLGSRGIQRKNLRLLAGVSPVVRAARVAREAGCTVLVTSEAPIREQAEWGCEADIYLERPAALASDTASMLNVVIHALETLPVGQRQVVLLQPTQPLRTAAHVLHALEMLPLPRVDSVVSVRALPLTHHPDAQLTIGQDNRLSRACGNFRFPPTRQSAKPTYIRDGTVYAFWRTTVAHYGDIYGRDVVAMVMAPEETCALDTPEDWREAERRLSPTTR